PDTVRRPRWGFRRHRGRRAPPPVRDVLLGGAARREPPHVPFVRLAGGEGPRGPLPRRVPMTTLGLVNIGALATGVLASPRLDAEAILVEHGRIAALGAASKTGAGSADVVVDCRGTPVIAG